MCGTCGCGQPDGPVILKPGEENNADDHHGHDHSHHHHHHHHDHEHEHEHDQFHEQGRQIEIERDILHKNNLLAERNRGFFEARGIIALNLVSSPGSGKTSLLEKTILKIKNDIPLFIIEGDQQTMQDANRIHKAGAPVVQINTGSGCHLDADMINKAVKKLNPVNNAILFIENVGNLVCPSMFDLGETKRVVIISVTEGEDKPLKYPTMFETSDLCIINKTDLLPYVEFDTEKVKNYALQVNHRLDFITLSAKTEEGIGNWLNWLNSLRQQPEI